MSPDRALRPRFAVSQGLLCALALVVTAPVGLWILDASPSTAPAGVEGTPAPTRAPVGYSALLDPAFTGDTPGTFADSAPLSARLVAAPVPLVNLAALDPPPRVEPSPVVMRDVPLPLPRPAELALADTPPVPAPTDRHMIPQTEAVPAAHPTGRRTFFERMFGKSEPSGTALAYANPENSGLGIPGLGRTVSADRFTAVYDISTHTVTLPDGTRLEAHSGLGAAKDNPGSVTEHMRGATPPNVYELTPREGMFHGVAALRLNPVGGTTFGRGGLLAHSYMLGPRGDSNGCVVFKDYRAFRQAYDSGMVRRLEVVAGGG